MKYCTHCGKEVVDEAIICPNCGCSVQYGNTASNLNKGSAGYSQQRPAQPNQSYNADLDSYSSMCVVGFVFAFLSPLIGLILSIVAFNDAKKTGSGKTLSLSRAGIIVSAVLLGLGVFVAILVLAFYPLFFWWIYI